MEDEDLIDFMPLVVNNSRVMLILREVANTFGLKDYQRITSEYALMLLYEEAAYITR